MHTISYLTMPKCKPKNVCTFFHTNIKKCRHVHISGQNAVLGDRSIFTKIKNVLSFEPQKYGQINRFSFIWYILISCKIHQFT